MGTYLFLSAAAMLAGFLVDCLIGDPYWIPHPVCAIGKWISFFEKRLRARFPMTERGELIAGRWLVVLVTAVSTLVPLAVSLLAYLIHPWVYFAVETVMCWQIFAAHSLRRWRGKIPTARVRRFGISSDAIPMCWTRTVWRARRSKPWRKTHRTG